MSRALLSDMFRAIRHSMSRFISMIIIVALGTGFFVGMKSTGPSMTATANEYYNSNNLMDIRVQSAIGLTDEDLAAIRAVEGVETAAGAKFADALVLVNGEPELDIDGSQISTRAYGINLTLLQEYYYGGNNPQFINRPTLIEGAYPTSADECLVDASELSTPDSYKVGSVITLEADSKADLSSLTTTQFKIVGIIRSPYYLSFERGNSLVGSGKIGTYIYIPDTAFTSDYYSEIYATVQGADAFDAYSEEYTQCVETVQDRIRDISPSYVQKRADELAETLPGRITSAQNEYNTREAEVQAALKTAEETIAQYQKYADDPEGAYNEAVEQVANALGVAENEFNGSSAEYNAAIEEYNNGLTEYKNKSAELETNKRNLAQAQAAVNTLASSHQTAQAALTTTKQLVATTKNTVESIDTILTSLEAYQNGQMDNEQLTSILGTLQSINPDLFTAIQSLSAVSLATEAMSLVTPYLESTKSQLALYEEQQARQQATLDGYAEQLATATAALQVANAAVAEAETQLNTAYETLNSVYDQLAGNQNQLTMAQIELMIGESSASNDLNVLKATIANAEIYLTRAREEYAAQKATAEAQLASAKNRITSAQRLLDSLDTASWSVYDRSNTPGYSSYQGAIDNVEVLSNIFPVIFFLVAALVCFTTMSRMVEEDRTQMGSLKALGYSSVTIAIKYLLYALLASIVGSTIGILIGVFALPSSIFAAYSIMFTLPPLSFTMPVSGVLLGMGISVATTLVAAVIACVRELKVRPATLMRPKAPKPGKRVLLERLPFIWKRMSFTGKVTTRNLFRRKTRFIMTVIGIAGCTALILASTGLYASVNNIMPSQYNEGGISNYDVQIVFAENQTEDTALMQTLASDARIGSIMLSSMQSVTGGTEDSDSGQDVYLFVPKSASALSSYINLRNMSSGETLTLGDSGAIITEGFARDTDTQVGESVWVDLADGRRVTIPVAGITENYAFNFIYVSENLYQYLFQETVEYSYAIGTVADTVKTDNASSGDSAAAKKAALANDLMSYDGINAVAYLSDTVDTLNEVINVLSIIIIIFIGAAGLLAFIVLYNLSNINISERQRELATIKVLGFHNNELASYIYRESIVLTIVGIAVGTLQGFLVHKMLLVYCAVDTVMFSQTLEWYCYLLAIVLTALFSLVVNFLMRSKIHSISMVESLKAVE